MDNDKKHLAMLAIPMLLSITFGFSGLTKTNAFFDDRDSSESEQNEVQKFEIPENSGQDKKTTVQYKNSPTVTGKSSNGADKIRHAIESQDYGSFLAVVEKTSFGEVMTKEAFTILVEEYNKQKKD